MNRSFKNNFVIAFLFGIIIVFLVSIRDLNLFVENGFLFLLALTAMVSWYSLDFWFDVSGATGGAFGFLLASSIVLFITDINLTCIFYVTISITVIIYGTHYINKYLSNKISKQKSSAYPIK